ncbi:XrtY-associated glycosyltransferase XYAG1 [Pseudopedobacter beijingensis]|uniref:XrtY-associated glycosyltransferase XYAG1 n=1 Tax=Pseudopedobacter beijingensis TaxID=1207056 RepID=A0ABW4I8I5_9SPHI
MKILHIVASYKPAYIYGGPVMSVAKLCEELNKAESRNKKQEIESSFVYPPPNNKEEENKGLREPQPDMRVVVYTTLANGKEELPYPSGTVKLVGGVEVHYFKRWTKDHSHFSPDLFWKLWKTAKDFDIIHIHAWWNLVSVFSCLIAVMKGKKVVFTPRGTLSTYSFNNRTSAAKKLFHQYIGKPLLKKCHIHTTSKREEIDMQILFNPKGITTLPNLVELPWEQADTLVQRHQDFNYSLKMIFLSRIEQKKGLELLFTVLSKIAYPFHLQIAGTGETDYIMELKQLSKQIGIAEQISWLGMLNKEEKFLQLAENDLFVLPSYDENFANVVIESLFTGTPVLITENVGLSDYVLENDLGWVCKRTKKNLLEKLNEAYTEISKQATHSKRIQDTITEDFKEDKLIKRYWEMYGEVLRGKL